MHFIINALSGKNPRADEVKNRTAAKQNRTPSMRSDSALKGIKSLQANEVQLKALYEYYT